jgi:DNA-directed RNA polymerase specialized sigma24 family protein
MSLLAWDEAAARPHVRAAVGRKLGMFDAFKDLSKEDLINECLIAVHGAMPRFDVARASFSTFVGTVAGRRLIDIWRRRSRQAGREATYAEANWGCSVASTYCGRDSEKPFTPIDRTTPLDHATAHEPDPAPDSPLADWLSTIYALAKRALASESRYRQGRRFFKVHQVVAVGLLMERESLTPAQARELFERWPHLARAVRFIHLPSPSWFREAKALSDQFLSKPGAREALAAFTPTLSQTVSATVPGTVE